MVNDLAVEGADLVSGHSFRWLACVALRQAGRRGVDILARNKERLMKKLATFLLVLAVCLSAADPWQSTPFAQWTDQDVQQVMSNSAWAHAVTITSGSGGETTIVGGGGGRRGGGIPGGTFGSPAVTTRVVVIWKSGLPERQAVLRLKYGSAVASMNTTPYLAADDPSYVIIVNNIPMSAVKGDAAKVKEAIRKRT